MQPASQSCPIETKEDGPRLGKRCASVALIGSPLIGRFPILVETMLLPSGRYTLMGAGVGRTLTSVALSMVKKCPVAPVSAIGLLWILFVLVGGSFCEVGSFSILFTVLLMV